MSRWAWHMRKRVIYRKKPIFLKLAHFFSFPIEITKKRSYHTEESDSINQPEGESVMSNTPVLPTKEQAEWLRSEIGVIIHLDLQVFENTYNSGRFKYTLRYLTGLEGDAFAFYSRLAAENGKILAEKTGAYIRHGAE